MSVVRNDLPRFVNLCQTQQRRRIYLYSSYFLYKKNQKKRKIISNLKKARKPWPKGRVDLLMKHCKVMIQKESWSSNETLQTFYFISQYKRLKTKDPRITGLPLKDIVTLYCYFWLHWSLAFLLLSPLYANIQKITQVYTFINLVHNYDFSCHFKLVPNSCLLDEIMKIKIIDLLHWLA